MFVILNCSDNNMKILITGIPCTGKSTLSISLAKKLNYKVYSDKDFLTKTNYKIVKEYGLKLKDVDLCRFAKQTNKKLAHKQDFILEGLIFPYCLHRFKFQLDYIFILHLSEQKLKQRMKKRKYPDAKILDNLFVQETNQLYYTILASLGQKKFVPLVCEVSLYGNKQRDMKKLKWVLFKWNKEKIRIKNTHKIP